MTRESEPNPTSAQAFNRSPLPDPQTIKAGVQRVQYIFLMGPIRLSNSMVRTQNSIWRHSPRSVSAKPSGPTRLTLLAPIASRMLPWDIPHAFERRNIEQALGRGCFAEKLQRRQEKCDQHLGLSHAASVRWKDANTTLESGHHEILAGSTVRAANKFR